MGRKSLGGENLFGQLSLKNNERRIWASRQKWVREREGSNREPEEEEKGTTL